MGRKSAPLLVGILFLLAGSMVIVGTLIIGKDYADIVLGIVYIVKTKPKEKDTADK